MHTIRFALVGAQGFARSHLRSIGICEAEGLCSLDAIVIRPVDIPPGDPRRDEFLHKGVRIHDSLDDLLRAESGRIDGVCIPCGIHEHHHMSIAALEAGYHVLCEKPVAGTLDDALDMKAAAERTGRMLAIGFQNIHSPSMQRIKELALSRRYGRLLEARSYALWPRTSAYYSRTAWAGKDMWQGRVIHDSPIQNGVAHYLQNLLYAAGASLHESAQPCAIKAENYRAKNIEAADTQVFMVRTAESVPLFFAASHAVAQSDGPIAWYHFEHATARWQEDGSTVVCDPQGHELERFGNDGMDIHTQVFRDFCGALHSGSPTLCTIYNAWQHTWCIHKAYESSMGIHALNPGVVEEIHGAYDPYTGRADPSNINQVVPGLEDLIRRICELRMGFDALKVPWAHPGEWVE